MTDCDIRKKLDEQLPDKNRDLVVACWGIAIGHREDLHCGTHTHNMRACMESIQFPDLLKHVYSQVDELWATGRTTGRVVCICENGVHQSVAVAAIMQDIYHQEGYNSKVPHHLSKCDALPRKCWNCTECKANVQKATLMSVAQAEFIRGQLL
jgi:hypothetical protein